MFKQGRDPVPIVMRRLVRRLERTGIDHAVMGGMAVYAHGHKRMTNDVDVLLTPAGLQEFRRLFVPKHYEQVAGRNRCFLDRRNQVIVDAQLMGHFPGRDGPGPIVFPDPAKVQEQHGGVYYLNLTTLVELKLAARRHQDLADVVNLIAAHNLDDSFADRLHSSVRDDYVECLDEKRREEEYQSRDD